MIRWPYATDPGELFTFGFHSRQRQVPFSELLQLPDPERQFLLHILSQMIMTTIIRGLRTNPSLECAKFGPRLYSLAATPSAQSASHFSPSRCRLARHGKKLAGPLRPRHERSCDPAPCMDRRVLTRGRRRIPADCAHALRRVPVSVALHSCTHSFAQVGTYLEPSVRLAVHHAPEEAGAGRLGAYTVVRSFAANLCAMKVYFLARYLTLLALLTGVRLCNVMSADVDCTVRRKGPAFQSND